MAEAVTIEKKAAEPVSALQAWRPLETLRREMDRLFEDFDRDSWRFPFRRSVFDIEPFWRRELKWGAAPAVDVVEKENAYEITAELPGMDEKNIEVKLADGGLTIKGSIISTTRTMSPGSRARTQSGTASTPPNSLKRRAFPSITGRPASGPISPSPRTREPSDTIAIVLPRFV